MTEISVQDHSSQYYDKRYSGLGMAYHKETISWLMKHAKLKVLDAGCGTGIISELYKDVYLDITGVDVSTEMLKKHPGKYIHCSVSEMPFPDGYFDFIVCRSLLHHLPYPYPAVKEMHRVLKPSGRIALWETNKSALAQMVRKRTQHGDRFSEYHHSFSGNELKSLVSSFFKVDEIRHMGYLQYPLYGFPDIIDFTPYIPFNNFTYNLTGSIDRFLEKLPVIKTMSWAIGIQAFKEGHNPEIPEKPAMAYRAT